MKRAKTIKYVTAATVAAFAVVIRGRETLVGFEPESKGGRIALPGGKLEPPDRGDPDSALYRELRQEVGQNLTYRQVSQPLVFCTSTARDHNMVIPGRGQVVDLRLFYLLEAIGNAEPEEMEPGEFCRPCFVPESFFHGRQKGRDIRTAVAYALKKFRGKGMWPVIPANQPTVQTDFALLREQLRTIDRAGADSVGFAPEFIEYLTHHPGGESPFRMVGQSARQARQVLT